MRVISGIWGGNASDSTRHLEVGAAPWTGPAHELSFFHNPALAQLATSPRTALIGELRIDNRRELAGQMRISSLGARPVSDADILLHLWERHGIEGFRRIEGEFAAAIFDCNARRLILAVDALGLRSLHYARRKGGLGFATSAVPVARWRGVVAPDLTRLASLLITTGTVGERSILEGVQRVRPGHAIICERPAEAREERWWTPDLSPIRLGFDEAVNAVRGELDHAVRTQVRTDTRVVAAQLSGGLDSAAVGLSATDVLAEGQQLVAVTGEPVGHREIVEHRNWFVDEAAYAAETAQMLPCTTHLRVRVEPVSPFDSIDRWFSAGQYPLMNACNASWMDATYAAAKGTGAAQLLSGNLGNATISHDGYHLLRDSVLQRRWGTFVRALAERKSRGARWRGLGFMAGNAIAPGLVERLLRRWHGEHTAAAYRDLLLRPDNPHLAAAVNERRRHDRQVLRLYDRQDEVAAERLASMQSLHLAADPVAVRTLYGLELLDPTAARRVVELCLRIPETYFLRKGERRAVARAMLRGRIPDRVVNERRKGEQGTNWRPGFELARNVMEAEIAAIDEGSELAALLDVPRMRQVMRSWPTDNWTDPAQVELYRYTLMRTIVVARFDRWLREGAVGAE